MHSFTYPKRMLLLTPEPHQTRKRDLDDIHNVSPIVSSTAPPHPPHTTALVYLSWPCDGQKLRYVNLMSLPFLSMKLGSLQSFGKGTSGILPTS